MMINNSIKYLEKLDIKIMPPQGVVHKFIETLAENEYEPAAENEAIPVDQSGETAHNEVWRQGRVDSLIWAFRDIGYIYADLNPLGNDYQEHYTNLPLIRKGIFEKLTPEDFSLAQDDMDGLFHGGPAFNHEKRTLRQIMETYGGIYCSTTGMEFLHIQNKEIRKWFIQNIERERNRLDLSLDEKRIIIEDLIKAEEFEHYLHKNYLGQRRFSIEGAETVIPVLHHLVNSASAMNVKEVVIGTTHSGRLTILNLILQLPPVVIFYLFEENYDPEMVDGGGDVKYHIGYSSEHVHENGEKIRITLPPNASHLESVDAVVEGRARGIQDKIGDRAKKKVIPVILHGEAAFSGQGVAAETLNLAGLEGYTTGGTIHIIINNQVGFTASTRSEHTSGFATDLAKYTSMPIIHVNGDDPEAGVRAMKLALNYREAFGRDILIDIICFRKYGHNEGDDPSFTHPRMYELIRNHKSVAAIYSEKCIANNVMGDEEIGGLRELYREELKKTAERMHGDKNFKGFEGFTPHKIKYLDEGLGLKKDVGIAREIIDKISAIINQPPQGFKMHEKLSRILETRFGNFKDGSKVDWAFAESIAFGSLLLDGYPVRLSGQDSERGTFSQRHLAWWELGVDEPKYYIPLNHLQDGQAILSVYDSPLSEYSILGFEFGYSISCPGHLVIWEAQFGDFSNGAQVAIDNYIIAAEAKWNIRSSLVILLPHGYEGLGPEHSSGHLERLLQISAQENIQVCNVTTPAQYFCLLRRQAVLNVEKPLFIMTPKSLLRHPLAVSTIDELVKGHFDFVIDDPAADESKTARVLFCTGKIYYELFAKKEELKNDNTAIIRIEELYPFPQEDIEKILKKYKNAGEKFWVQEESQNRGAWTFIQYQFLHLFEERLKYIGRNPQASPATGSHASFRIEQDGIMNRAFGMN